MQGSKKKRVGKNAIVPNGAILSFFVTVVSQNLLLTKTYFVLQVREQALDAMHKALKRANLTA